MLPIDPNHDKSTIKDMTILFIKPIISQQTLMHHKLHLVSFGLAITYFSHAGAGPTGQLTRHCPIVHAPCWGRLQRGLGGVLMSPHEGVHIGAFSVYSAIVALSY